MKVHIYPSFGGEDQGDGGVRRVVERQLAHLPDFGIEQSREDEADLIACHITAPTTYLRLYPRTPLVAHCHGLYWAEYDWPGWALKANAEVMDLLRVADAITAPSEWVAQIIRRHLSRSVEVVYHGVDLAEWAPGGENHGYVLWNKTRPDPVCDPAPMNGVAALLPDVHFLSTFGEKASNVAITDRQPYEKAKTLVKSAGVYLCTAKETFGIGTLEALAAGVPVVGFRHGGQVEIIEHGVDGWLVEPGDLAGLAEGIRWALKNREQLALACQVKAGKFSWEAAAKRYAEIYEWRHHIATDREKRPKVSVIVTAYNLDRYLRDTLESIRGQTLTNWECLIVDDASPDRCGAIADEYAALDARFRAIHNPVNEYLATSRNIAIEAARGEYIFPLDADDMIAPTALETLARALDRDRTIHIAYGSVLFVNEDGRTPTDYHVEGQTPGHSGWPLPFVFESQARGLNYLPYASMYRREVWQQTAGYRRRCRTAEDADFWVRIASYGFRPMMVTTEDTLIYRNREGSMSRAEGQREWIHWFPWGANIEIAPAGAITREQLPVPSFDPPAISVIVPVGPGHERLVLDALDSVDAQSFRSWECIVVNDTGGALPPLPAWARVVGTGGHRGVAAARNAGIRVARGAYFLPLDADDLLQPDALQWLATAAEMHPGEIIYPDFWEDPRDPNVFTVYETPDYEPSILLRRGALHPVTALTPRVVWEKVGGYDESAPCWEDWLFQLAAIDLGVCSRRLAAPLFTYRKHTGARRESNQVDFERCKAAVLERYGKFWYGEKNIMGCGCNANPTVQSPAANMMAAARRGGTPAGAILVRYVGLRSGSVSFRGIDTGTVYTFAANEPPRWVYESDLETFRRKPRDYEILGPVPVGQESSAGNAAVAPILIAEGPPSRDFTPPAAYGSGPLDGVMNAAEHMIAAATPAVAVADRLPVSEERYNSIEEVPEDIRIRALMGLGMSRDEAEKRVRG